MKKNDLISIVMPLYNSETTVISTIKSVLNQTYTNFELIIVDDGSTDESYENCQTIHDSRIKLFKIKNSGVSFARNYGISKSQGKWVCFIDSDDEYKPKFLEKLYLTAKQTNSDIVRANYDIKIGNVTSQANTLENDIVFSKANTNILVDDILSGHILSYVWLLLINKNIICKFNENLSLYEDMEFLLQVICNSKKAVFLSERLYTYNLNNSTSLSRSNFDKNINMLLESKDIILNTLKSINYYSQTRKSILYTRIYANISNYLYSIFDSSNFEITKSKIQELKGKNNFIEIENHLDFKFLKFTEKILCFLLKHNMLFGLKIIYNVKNIKNKKRIKL